VFQQLVTDGFRGMLYMTDNMATLNTTETVIERATSAFLDKATKLKVQEDIQTSHEDTSANAEADAFLNEATKLQVQEDASLHDATRRKIQEYIRTNHSVYSLARSGRNGLRKIGDTNGLFVASLTGPKLMLCEIVFEHLLHTVNVEMYHHFHNKGKVVVVKPGGYFSPIDNGVPAKSSRHG
jgi:hypothetical protein